MALAKFNKILLWSACLIAFPRNAFSVPALCDVLDWLTAEPKLKLSSSPLLTASVEPNAFWHTEIFGAGHIVGRPPSIAVFHVYESNGKRILSGDYETDWKETFDGDRAGSSPTRLAKAKESRRAADIAVVFQSTLDPNKKSHYDVIRIGDNASQTLKAKIVEDFPNAVIFTRKFDGTESRNFEILQSSVATLMQSPNGTEKLRDWLRIELPPGAKSDLAYPNEALKLHSLTSASGIKELREKTLAFCVGCSPPRLVSIATNPSAPKTYILRQYPTGLTDGSVESVREISESDLQARITDFLVLP